MKMSSIGAAAVFNHPAVCAGQRRKQEHQSKISTSDFFPMRGEYI